MPARRASRPGSSRANPFPLDPIGSGLERATGFEPATLGLGTDALPLSYPRVDYCLVDKMSDWAVP